MAQKKRPVNLDDTGIYRDVDGEPIPGGGDVADLHENEILIDDMQAPANEFLRVLEPCFRELYERAESGDWPTSAAPLEVIKRDSALALALLNNSRVALDAEAPGMAWNFGFRLGRLYERLLVRRVEDNARLGRQVREQRQKGGGSRSKLDPELQRLCRELIKEHQAPKVSKTAVCHRVAKALASTGTNVSHRTIQRNWDKLTADNA